MTRQKKRAGRLRIVASNRPSDPDKIPERLLRCLRRLDPEQLQIVEIIAAAIARGAM